MKGLAMVSFFLGIFARPPATLPTSPSCSGHELARDSIAHSAPIPAQHKFRGGPTQNQASSEMLRFELQPLDYDAKFGVCGGLYYAYCCHQTGGYWDCFNPGRGLSKEGLQRLCHATTWHGYRTHLMCCFSGNDVSDDQD
ncbi:hypothetical protein K461DRAFT_130245 [Myriangium duriaei CBS 260.36]|uniref:Chitin-binding type-2 domain-containing protein n=1 Tax=Myriangium duriaei CBS 260.36 TaxID=1168546 RepID=A0A9P4J3L1_9PEZI|nr:hypothetical protein K461DRAFT_130245 [Myriangium duriaei CBS 260.36]